MWEKRDGIHEFQAAYTRAVFDFVDFIKWFFSHARAHTHKRARVRAQSVIYRYINFEFFSYVARIYISLIRQLHGLTIAYGDWNSSGWCLCLLYSLFSLPDRSVCFLHTWKFLQDYIGRFWRKKRTDVDIEQYWGWKKGCSEVSSELLTI